MRKALSVLLSLALALLCLTACGKDAPSDSQPPESNTPAGQSYQDLRIAHLTGRRGDQGFVDSVYEGVMRFQEETGCTMTVMENTELGDYVLNARNFAQEGYDLIILTDSTVCEIVEELAQEYPDTHFIIAGGTLEGIPNVTSIEFAQDEMSFLAGAFSVLMNQQINGRPESGFVCGANVSGLKRAICAFQAGAAYVGGEATVAYVGNFTDIAKGKEIALQMYQSGIQVVQAFAGAASMGVYQAAESMPENYWAMGNDNGHFDKSDRIIASMIQSNTDAYYYLLKQFAQGELPSGVMEEMGLDSGSVNFDYNPTNADLVPQQIRDQIAELREQILSGEINPPINDEELETFLAGL